MACDWHKILDSNSSGNNNDFSNDVFLTKFGMLVAGYVKCKSLTSVLCSLWSGKAICLKEVRFALENVP